MKEPNLRQAQPEFRYLLSHGLALGLSVLPHLRKGDNTSHFTIVVIPGRGLVAHEL